MKNILSSVFFFCALAISAQNEIETFSVYDVNHDASITVEDVSSVVNHIVMANAESPQSVDAAALNTLLQSIDNRLARIEKMLGIENEEEPKKDFHEWVDLDLPSGTLWATCNVGATSPEEYGDYFAWGETQPKDTYNYSTYSLCNGSSHTMTKYCIQSKYGAIDDKTELDPEDDAATVNWGIDWQMPSINQINELTNSSYTTTTVTTQNEVYGYKIISKSNGASIFLPAAGYRGSDILVHAGVNCQYWSRSLSVSYSDYAYDMLINSVHVGGNDYNRSYGLSIRPVRK